METALPFGLLAQALEDLGGGGLLAGPTADAAVVDRAARFYGVLRWLEQRAGQRALLVLDDLHWADADSLALFCFICRRIAATAVGVLAAMRPWPAEALQAALGLAHEGCVTLERLAPLSDPAACALLAARVGRPSIAWALGVWWLGEGLGSVLTGSASPVSGAPGAVILYALLAVLLRPAATDRAAPFVAGRAIGAPAARGLWLILWGSLAYLALQPAARAPRAISSMIADAASGQPGWLAGLLSHGASAG